MLQSCLWACALFSESLCCAAAAFATCSIGKLFNKVHLHMLIYGNNGGSKRHTLGVVRYVHGLVMPRCAVSICHLPLALSVQALLLQRIVSSGSAVCLNCVAGSLFFAVVLCQFESAWEDSSASCYKHLQPKGYKLAPPQSGCDRLARARQAPVALCWGACACITRCTVLLGERCRSKLYRSA